ncbi:MAG: peptidase S1, partial [Burkholderiaceae bacterium]
MPGTAAGGRDAPAPDAADPAGRPPGRWRRFVRRHERLWLMLGALLLGLALLAAYDTWRRPAKALTQQDIDAAVLHTLTT